MVAWGQRAGLRWFGGNVTLQIASQDITAKDNYKTSRNTKPQRSHTKQGKHKTGRKTKPQYNTPENEINMRAGSVA
jgi:hypothetical protein